MAGSDQTQKKAGKSAGTTEEDRIEKKAKKSKIRKAAQKDESSITFYLHASLFLFFLTAYAFLLFLYKNKYPLILNNEILPEVLFFCFGLLVFSFLSLFLLSFWRFLARLFIAIIAGGTIAYILGLLFPYNIGNYLAHYLSFLPQDILMYFATNGNMIAACISGFLMFILLNIFKGGGIAFLSLPVLVSIFMLLNTASKQVMPEKIMTLDATSDREKEKTENLIYLILSDHAGYVSATENWQALNSKEASPETLPSSPAFISAFYKENNFTFFPATYLRFQSRFRNIGAALNPSLTEITDDLFNRNDAVYYISSDDSLIAATRNDLFKSLKEKGYHLNIYQSYPFDFCSEAGRQSIANCVTYPAPLGALYQTNLTTQSRLLLLFGHWLYSTPFGKQVAQYVYTKVNKKLDASLLPILGNPMSKSLPIGQSLILTHLRQDVLTAKGKNVFFAHLNLPHFPYIYDQNCQIRMDPSTWRSNAPYTDKKKADGELKRWEDYNQQLFCTYAQINYLINDLKTAKLLDTTTIVIHGDKGAGIQKESIDEREMTRVEQMLNRFENNMTTVFGIYKPKNKAKTDPVPCDLSTLVNRHVLGNTEEVCQPPAFVSFTKEEQDKAMAWIKAPINEKYLQTADYTSFYTPWLENGGQAFMASLDERLKQEKQNTSASKISFVAPPSFTDPQKKNEETAPVKEKTTSFVPVPEKTGKPLPEKQPEPLPLKEPETVSAAEVPATAPAQKKETPALPEKKEKTKQSSENRPAKETLPAEAALPALDVIVDDFGALPKPIVLPQSSAEDKWKTTDIKEGQKTTLELLPQGVEELPALPELPAVNEVQPLPQAAPAAQVEILPLPPATTTVEELQLPPMPPLPELTPVQQPSGAEANSISIPAETAVQAPVKQETPEISAAKEARTQAEAAVQTKVDEEAKALAEAEAQIKAAEEAKAKAEEAIQARAKAEEEARLKAEAEAKARAEEEARLKAEAEAQIKAAEEAKAKAEAAAKARAEAEAAAKAKAEEEARLKAEEEARLKAEAEAQIKAAQEAQAKARAEAAAAKAKAEEEERRKAEEAEREELRKKAPPPPANADELDIIKETTIERINEDGEVETFIYLERKPNPNRFKKKKNNERELQQQDLEHSQPKSTEDNVEKTQSAPQETESLEKADDSLVKNPPSNEGKTEPVAVQQQAASSAVSQPADAQSTEAPAKEVVTPAVQPEEEATPAAASQPTETPVKEIETASSQQSEPQKVPEKRVPPAPVVTERVLED